MFFKRKPLPITPVDTGRDFAGRYSQDGVSQLPSENPLRIFFNAHRVGPGVWKWDHYFDAYHRHLQKFRGRNPRIAEIGIYSGGSLIMQQSYFGNPQIYGVDIEPTCGCY